MNKLIAAEFLSLDGVMEDPSWTMPYWNDEIANYKFDELFSSEAHLLGRVTYEGFAAAWPGRTDEKGFSDRMNNLPKYVVSKTLQNPSWQGTTVIRQDIPGEIQKLKAEAGGNILLAGSAALMQTLIAENLVDEYHLLVYPVVVGKGKRLFQDGCQAKLKLAECRQFSSGVVLQVYQPDR
ncbi:MAG: dihydrofolate reductase family protein [Chloroflexota bacterium]